MLHLEENAGMAAHPDTLDDAVEDARVLSDATRRAGAELGLDTATIAAIVHRSRTRLADPIRPDRTTGELAMMFLRVYRGLFALVGGDREAMRRWVTGPNAGTGGVPVEQMKSVEGLARVLRYVDAMRGKL